jgi:hypothetical protein
MHVRHRFRVESTRAQQTMRARRFGRRAVFNEAVRTWAEAFRSKIWKIAAVLAGHAGIEDPL